MNQFYHCPTCRTTLSSSEVIEQEESTPSEFWGVRTVQLSVYHVCGTCGDDVEETTAPEEEPCCDDEIRDEGQCISCGDI